MSSQFETFDYSLLIREHHLDTFDHINNATYLQILEEARWEFITRRGYGLQKVQQTQMGPVVLEFNIQFKKEITLRENILIQSEVISYDKKIGILRQDIFDESKELCCAAKMTFGLFDLAQRKLMLPTEEWLLAIGLKEKLEST